MVLWRPGWIFNYLCPSSSTSPVPLSENKILVYFSFRIGNAVKYFPDVFEAYNSADPSLDFGYVPNPTPIKVTRYSFVFYFSFSCISYEHAAAFGFMLVLVCFAWETSNFVGSASAVAVLILSIIMVGFCFYCFISLFLFLAMSMFPQSLLVSLIPARMLYARSSLLFITWAPWPPW